jgi:hypothetical protein
MSASELSRHEMLEQWRAQKAAKLPKAAGGVANKENSVANRKSSLAGDATGLRKTSVGTGPAKPLAPSNGQRTVIGAVTGAGKAVVPPSRRASTMKPPAALAPINETTVQQVAEERRNSMPSSEGPRLNELRARCALVSQI